MESFYTIYRKVVRTDFDKHVWGGGGYFEGGCGRLLSR